MWATFPGGSPRSPVDGPAANRGKTRKIRSRRFFVLRRQHRREIFRRGPAPSVDLDRELAHPARSWIIEGPRGPLPTALGAPAITSPAIHDSTAHVDGVGTCAPFLRWISAVAVQIDRVARRRRARPAIVSFCGSRGSRRRRSRDGRRGSSRLLGPRPSPRRTERGADRGERPRSWGWPPAWGAADQPPHVGRSLDRDDERRACARSRGDLHGQARR